MVKAIVGANWGDEGKGKITDMLAADSDIVIRFQGGANAGHTIINEYGKFALHLLPSGSFNQNVTNMIGNGGALDIPELIKEIDEVVKRGVPKPNIVVSERTQVLMPYHKLFDQYEEERLSDRQFGSTKSGIAPFFSDKFSKIATSFTLSFPNSCSCRSEITTVRTGSTALSVSYENVLTVKTLYDKKMLAAVISAMRRMSEIVIFKNLCCFIVITFLRETLFQYFTTIKAVVHLL